MKQKNLALSNELFMRKNEKKDSKLLINELENRMRTYNNLFASIRSYNRKTLKSSPTSKK